MRTYVDVFSVSNFDLPPGASGVRAGMKYAVVLVDCHSRKEFVYFCKRKSSVPSLLRLFLLQVGTPALFNSHFVVREGVARQMRLHTDGGKELNFLAMEKLLL